MHTVIKGPSEQKTKLVSLISKQNKSFMLDFFTNCSDLCQ